MMNKQNYIEIKQNQHQSHGLRALKKFFVETFKVELFKGLGIVFGQMKHIHTVQYPLEALPIGPRYRAVHELL